MHMPGGPKMIVDESDKKKNNAMEELNIKYNVFYITKYKLHMFSHILISQI